MASLTKTLDKQWSRLVKLRAKEKCEVCGATKENVRLNSHHIIGRVNRRTRWDLRNGVCLCVQHHKFGRQSAHEDPVWFNKWLEEHKSKDYEYIKSIKNDIKKWTPSEKKELIEEHKEKLKELEDSH